MKTLKSWWTYILEGFGYKRPPPLTAEDIRERDDVAARLDEFDRFFRMVSARRDALRRYKNGE